MSSPRRRRLRQTGVGWTQVGRPRPQDRQSDGDHASPPSGLAGRHRRRVFARSATRLNQQVPVRRRQPAVCRAISALLLLGAFTAPTQSFAVGIVPIVTSVAPASGPTAGGVMVTITGNNFSAGAKAVKFGDANATQFTWLNDVEITAIAPAHAAGPVDITVVGFDGVSAVNAGYQFTFLALPAVTGIAPASGPTTGGSPVTITGSAFSGATAVKFGASDARGFTVDSPTQITAVAPAGAGRVDVTVMSPGGTSATGAADQYTFATPSPVPTLSEWARWVLTVSLLVAGGSGILLRHRRKA